MQTIEQQITEQLLTSLLADPRVVVLGANQHTVADLRSNRRCVFSTLQQLVLPQSLQLLAHAEIPVLNAVCCTTTAASNEDTLHLFPLY